MIHSDGWYFPDGESHLVQWMQNPKVRTFMNGRAAYQGAKQVIAMGLCTSFRTACDCGAHIGLHSFNLAHKFDRVIAFEPVAAHRDCFVKNVLEAPGVTNVTLEACALGAAEGSVSIRTEPTSSGDSRVDGDGDIPMHTLDRFDLENLSYLKIDCEGTELFVLQGAEATIVRCKPVIMVEQKPGHAQKYGLGETDAVPYLESLGYRVARELSGDFIMVPA